MAIHDPIWKDPQLLELENQIRAVPWRNDFPNPYVSAAQTHDLYAWCKLKGMPDVKLNRLGREQLEKCYCIKNYFDTVAGNRPSKNPATRAKSVATLLGEKLSADWQSGASPVPTSVQSLADVYKVIDQRPQTPGGVETPEDHVKYLLTAVAQEVDRKIGEVKVNLDRKIGEVKVNLTENLAKGLRDSFNGLENDIINNIENGKLDIKLGKGLEDKIQSLVRNSADEIIFQALKSRPQVAGCPESGREQGELIPELVPDLDPDALLPPPSPFIPRLDPNFYFDPFASKVIRKALSSGRHVYASGPAGCGKTTHFEQVCAMLNHGIFRVNPHDGLTKSFFLGETKLKSGENGSETYFQPGALPIAMTNGLAFIIDEFSFLPPNLAAVMHPVMEENGKLYIPETGEIITPKPGFVVFATDNTGGKGDSSGQFVGTEVQNTATLDRFSFKLQMDYLPADKEHEMLLGKFKSWLIESDEELMTELYRILSLARDIRQAFAQGELAITLSTRGLIDYFSHREQGFSSIEALNLRLLSWLDDDDKELVKVMLDRLQIKLED